MATKIRGILTPHMVPLDAQGNILEAELRRYVDWLIDRGVHGLYPNGSTGEFIRFTPDERRRIVRIVCEQAAGRVPVLAGAAEANVRETVAACEEYTRYGARAGERVDLRRQKAVEQAIAPREYAVEADEEAVNADGWRRK